MKKKQAAAAVVNPAEANLPEQTILNLNSQLCAPQLLEQANTCLENLERAVDFQRMIMQHWKCHNDGCCNQNNLCYVDLWDGKHYAIAKIQHKAWANAMTVGDAVINQPPD